MVSRRNTDAYLNDYLPESLSPPLITGDDLIHEFHLPPSPVFQKILRHVHEERVLKHIRSRDEALLCVKNFLKSKQ
jgi:hypothetical protein